MAGGRGKIHLHPNAGTNGFDKRPEDARKGGRKPSIRREYINTLNSEGRMWLNMGFTGTKEEFEEFSKLVAFETRTRWTTVKVNGKPTKRLIYEIALPLTNIQKMLVRLDKIVTGKNDRVALEGIKFLWEQVDGKADQNVNHSVDTQKMIESRNKIRSEDHDAVSGLAQKLLIGDK